MKKIAKLDDKLLAISENENPKPTLPTRRSVLQMIGNAKADTADDSRRVVRILGKIRNEKVIELVLENDDMNFLLKMFEKNAVSLTSWAQGQIIEIIESAENVTQNGK